MNYNDYIFGLLDSVQYVYEGCYPHPNMEDIDIGYFKESALIKCNTLESFIAVVSTLINRSFIVNTYHCPQMMEFRVKTDCKGDDFEGIIVSIKIKAAREWALRYFGQERKAVPELMNALNILASNDNSNVSPIIEKIINIEKEWISKRKLNDEKSK